jgi:hypothetical protein
LEFCGGFSSGEYVAWLKAAKLPETGRVFVEIFCITTVFMLGKNTLPDEKMQYSNSFGTVCRFRGPFPKGGIAGGGGVGFVLACGTVLKAH